MPYPKAKIYKQGGHFIAIPHTEQPHKERRKAVETEIFVEDSPDETQKTTVEIAPLPVEESKASEAGTNPQIELVETKPQDEMPKPKRGRITTKRKLFDELYKTYYSERKRTRRKLICRQCYRISRRRTTRRCSWIKGCDKNRKILSHVGYV